LINKAILVDTPLPAPPNPWVTTTPAQIQQDNGSAGNWYRELTYWWYNRMLSEGLNMQEKMVLFFHNHFANERDKVSYPQNMYVQNQLFRKYAFGNFKQLVKDVSKDPAMLIYLDGNNSRGANPNENYARELMELFTMGIGNYTETDVKQASSDEFYKASIQGSKIKNPTELMVGTSKLLQIKMTDTVNLYELSRTLQMQLFQPPDVAGWPGQREWISSTTYSHRGGFTDSLLTGRRFNGVAVTGKIETLPFARSFATAEKAVEFVDEVVGLALRFPLSDARKKFLLDTLLDGTTVMNWTTYVSNADTRINKFLKTLMRLPEYQLC
jgi:hypothetical protein